MPTCCIDFDGTIAEWAKYPDPGPPTEGVKEALEKLKDLGFTIVISSARTSEDFNPHLIDRKTEIKRMENYLNEHKIPYDTVLMSNKMPATYYIDDRAIEFKNNWKEITDRIKKEM